MKYAAIALAFALAACAGAAGDVSVLQAHGAAIAAGSTYAWQPVSAKDARSGDPRIDNDIIRQRIRSAVDSALAAKGYRRVDDPTGAQLLVSYHLGLQNGTDYRVETTMPLACGWRGCSAGYGWGMYGPPTDVRAENYTDGTLIIDLTDRASNTLAWRATSRQRVDRSDAEQAALNDIAADMVKSLPGTN